jgi:DGQHR domain-containing protein
VEAEAETMTEPEFDLADPDRREISVPALKANQPIGDLYVAVISAADLGLIANFDVRRVLQEERDVERYLGIQRPLNPQRVAALEKYVKFSDATFPTSIIIAIDDEYAVYDENEGLLSIRNYREGEKKPSRAIRRIARVIDGQHRIAGLYALDKQAVFNLPVTVFIGSDIADQAYVFATVNIEQTKVSRSLTYDLFELAKTRSPQHTCHNIAVILDTDEDSPFRKRIKRLGVATPGRVNEIITQATFVENLMPYISDDAKTDRDLLLRGVKLKRVDDEEARRLIFRNMFIDESDIDIANVVFNFFDAVRKRWEKGWTAKERGLILNRTNGFRALMRIMRLLYLKLGHPGDVVSANAFLSEFRKVPVDHSHFNTDNYPPGSSGESQLRIDFINWLDLTKVELRRSRA